LLCSLLIYQVDHLTNMPICACNKVKQIIKPNTNNSDYNVDEQVAVSSFYSHALDVNSNSPTFKTQRYGKGEGAIQFMKLVPVLILQGMKVKVVTQDTSSPTTTKKKISLNWVDDLVGRVEDLGDNVITGEKDDCVILGKVRFVIFDGSVD